MRVHKTTDYTVMSNFHLRDRRLTLKAKGLLSVILSLPQDWVYSIAGLTAICAEGECAVKSALHELKTCGYLVIEKLNPTADNGGRYEYMYHIYEQPNAGKEQKNESPEIQEIEEQEVEKQEVDFLPLENHPLNKNTKEVNKDNKEKKILNNINKEVICEKKEKCKKCTKAPKVESKAARFIPPTVEEVRAYCEERQNNVDPQKFVDFYEAKGWLIGKSKMKNWKAAVRTWETTDKRSKKGDFIPDEIKKRLEKWSV